MPAATRFALAFGLAASIAMQGAFAQEFPSRPIRIVVGFPPGGSTDVLARLVARGMSDSLKQPVVVENRPGADTILATEHVARAPKDGYTLLIGASSAMTINPLLKKKLPYDARKDFAPITLLGAVPLVLVVNPAVPARSLSELVALSKKDPAGISYGAGSVAFHLATELVKAKTGANFHHVPYKGTSLALQAVMAGEVPFAFMDTPPLMQQLAAGKVRPVAISSLKSSPLIPQVPPVSESGVPGFDLKLWIGLFAPAGTPDAVISKVQQTISQLVQQPDMKARLLALGVEPGGERPEEVRQLIDAEQGDYADAVQAAGLKAE